MHSFSSARDSPKSAAITLTPAVRTCVLVTSGELSWCVLIPFPLKFLGLGPFLHSHSHRPSPSPGPIPLWLNSCRL